jgi:NAD(P)H-quinone oxidoreductase subunit 4
LDFKKLIAFATIQEMNIILLFLVLTNNINDYIFVVFIFIHGLLSTLMFYVVDLIQKRTSTRNLIELSGFGISNPKMRQIL